jgi:hypothetical protein
MQVDAVEADDLGSFGSGSILLDYSSRRLAMPVAITTHARSLG